MKSVVCRIIKTLHSFMQNRSVLCKLGRIADEVLELHLVRLKKTFCGERSRQEGYFPYCSINSCAFASEASERASPLINRAMASLLPASSSSRICVLVSWPSEALETSYCCCPLAATCGRCVMA